MPRRSAEPMAIDWAATGRRLGGALSLFDPDGWDELLGEAWEGLRGAEAPAFVAFVRGFAAGIVSHTGSEAWGVVADLFR